MMKSNGDSSLEMIQCFPILCENEEKADECDQIQLTRPLAPIQAKKPIRKRKKQLKQVIYILQPMFNLKHERKYLISGDLVIDVNYIKDNLSRGEGGCQGDFRSPLTVKFHHQRRFFEIVMQRHLTPLKDFSFLVSMFNSLGDKECHIIAQRLLDYQQMFERFEEIKQSQNSNGVTFGETPILSCHKSLLEQIPFSENWSYLDSCEKAKELIDQIEINSIENQYNMYQVVKGDCSTETLMISERSQLVFFGKNTIHEQTKLFLSHKNIMIEKSIFEIISKKQNALSFYLQTLSDQSNHGQFFTSNETEVFSLVNHEVVSSGVELQRIPLSNYPNSRPNDILIRFSIFVQQPVSMKSSEIVQVSSSENLVSSGDEFLKFDVPYTMMSEHFTDKFYGQSSEHSNKIQQKNKKEIQQKETIRSYHQSLKNNSNKICRYRLIHQSQPSSNINFVD